MTATTKIIAWVNDSKHPIWWKLAVRLQLENPILTAEHFDLIYRTARKEAGFNEEIAEFSDFSKAISAAGYNFEEYPVILTALGPTDNIASLADQQILPFSPTGMTVIYGDNGVGKSSYAKILKNCCLTRGEKPPVVGNIFSGNVAPSRATIRYRVGAGDENTVEWTRTSDQIPDLKAIRVFDSKSAIHYVEKEGELAYRPAGLHLLDGLASACRYVKTEVEKKLLPLAVSRDLPVLDETSSAGLFLASISHESTAEALNSHCASDAEIASLEILQREIVEMKTKTAEQIRKNLNRVLGAIKPLIKTIEDASSALSYARFVQISGFRESVTLKSASAEAARALAFGEVETQGIGTSSWVDLWNAAKAFSKDSAIALEFPPEVGAPCPLCLQEVTEIAFTRLHRFEAYVVDVTQTEARKARETLDLAIKEVNKHSLDLTPYGAIILQLDEDLPEIEKEICEFSASFVKWKNALISDGDIPNELTTDDENIGQKILRRLRDHRTYLELQILQLVDEASFAKLLSDKVMLENNIKSKKALREGRAMVEAEIKRRKAVSFYSKIKAQTNPRTITTQSTMICADYVTGALKNYFVEELSDFGFKNYDVIADVRGADASQLFKLKLSKATASVSAIASEGELKCLALAGIFAELRSDGRKSCVVFDDPVNSLDHKWRSKVASRMVRLSSEMQVIIFTHDIVFLKLLLEVGEETEGAQIDVVNLDRGRKSTGIITHSPPWDALTTAKRIKYLDVLYRDLRKIDAEGTDHEYDNAAGSLYGYLREAWERLVEEKLLNKVVERFGRGVSTQRLKRLSDISDTDISRIDVAMTKCSGLFKGHDAAPGIHQAMPGLADIALDIDALRIFEKELTDQRKRSG